MDFREIQENLEKKNYTVKTFENKESATAYLKGEIAGTSVAFGGSMTVKQTGVFEALQEENVVFWHWNPLMGRSSNDTLQLARNAEFYISSVNGIAETGEIINIDGAGNRVAATINGYKKVFLLVGKNKIEKTLEEARKRAWEVAAPLNAKRLFGDDAGQAEIDKICTVEVVFYSKPTAANIEVILIDEELGY